MKFLLSLLLLPFIFGIAMSNTIRHHNFAKAGPVADSGLIKSSYYSWKGVYLTALAPAEAVKNYRKALLSTGKRDKLWEADIRTEMGVLLSRLKNPEAMAQLDKAAQLYKERKDVNRMTFVSGMVAGLYLKNGRFQESVKRHTDLFRVQSAAGEAVLAGNTASRLADLYEGKKMYKEAFSYADMAKNEYEKVCRRDSLGSVYFKIARIKKKQNKPKLSEFYIINKALPFYTSADYFQGRLKCFNFLANMYMDQKRYSEAKWFYLQANSQAKGIKDTASTIGSLQQLAVLKAITGSYLMAKQDLAEAEFLSRESGADYLTDRFKMRYSSLVKKIDLKTVAVGDDLSVKNTNMRKEAPPLVVAD